MNEQAAGIGHNRSPFEALSDKVAERIAATDRFIKEVGPEIGDQVTADRAADFLEQLTAEAKAVEAERKTEKQPHLDAAAAVDQKFSGMGRALKTAIANVKKRLTPWLQEVDRRQRAEAEAAREAAEKARREAHERQAAIEAKERAEAEAREKAEAEAEAAREAASGPTIAEQIEAEDSVVAALAAQKAAAKAERERPRAKGDFTERAKTLRKMPVGVITDQGKVYRRFKNDPIVLEALQRCVNRDVRGGNLELPGVEIEWREQAV